MNHDEVMALSEQELVQAVIVSFGYRKEMVQNPWVLSPSPFYETMWFDEKKQRYFTAPNYLHDPNACLELIDDGQYWYIERVEGGYRVHLADGWQAMGEKLTIAILRAYLLSREE